MEVFSIVLLILAGQSISFGFGRLFFCWTYDLIVMEIFVTTFSVGFLALIVLTKLGANGFVLSLISSVLLPYVFIKFNVGNNRQQGNAKSIFGCLFWLILVIIFFVTVFKLSDVSLLLNKLYSLGDNAILYVMGVFIVTSILSIHMFTYECKLFLKKI